MPPSSDNTKHNLKLPPSKARRGSRDADFLGHSVSPAVVHPNAEQLSALMNKFHAPGSKARPCPDGRCGLLSKFPARIVQADPPDNVPSPEGGQVFEVTPAIEVIVREIFAELTTPPILVFPDWGAVADGSRPFHSSCDACVDDLVLRLNRNSRSAQGGPSLTSAALASVPRDTEPRSIWNPSGLSTTSRLPLGHEV